jgi:hypothetical protein
MGDAPGGAAATIATGDRKFNTMRSRQRLGGHRSLATKNHALPEGLRRAEDDPF